MNSGAIMIGRMRSDETEEMENKMERHSTILDLTSETTAFKEQMSSLVVPLRTSGSKAVIAAFVVQSERREVKSASSMP